MHTFHGFVIASRNDRYSCATAVFEDERIYDEREVKLSVSIGGSANIQTAPMAP